MGQGPQRVPDLVEKPEFRIHLVQDRGHPGDRPLPAGREVHRKPGSGGQMPIHAASSSGPPTLPPRGHAGSGRSRTGSQRFPGRTEKGSRNRERAHDPDEPVMYRVRDRPHELLVCTGPVSFRPHLRSGPPELRSRISSAVGTVGIRSNSTYLPVSQSLYKTPGDQSLWIYP